MIVLGVSGKSKHGKDVFCQEVIDKYGPKYDIRRYSFGDAVKVELYNRLLDPSDSLWKRTKYLGQPTLVLSDRNDILDYINSNKDLFREAMQVLGDGERVDKSPFIWIRKVREVLEKEKPQIAIITDVRYKNELYFVNSYTGFSVRVNRIGYLNPKANNNHISETDLDSAKFDFVIDCLDGAVDELKEKSCMVFDLVVDALTPEIPDDILFNGGIVNAAKI